MYFPLKHKCTHLLKAYLLICHVTVAFHENPVFTVKKSSFSSTAGVHSLCHGYLLLCCLLSFSSIFDFRRSCIAVSNKARKNKSAAVWRTWSQIRFKMFSFSYGGKNSSSSSLTALWKIAREYTSYASTVHAAQKWWIKSQFVSICSFKQNVFSHLMQTKDQSGVKWLA